MRKAICCLGLLLSGILPLAAQSGPGGEKRAVAGRSAWFACLSIPDGLENPVKLMGGKNLTELTLPRYMTSEPVKIPADGILRIIREAPDPDPRAKPKYLVLAEARIPEGVREALIILAPLTKPEGDLIFQAKVQDLAAFKGGDRLFINLSNTPIRVRFGNDKVTVAPGRSDIYAAPVLAKPTNMPVMYEFYHPEQEKWRVLSASTVVLRPTRRNICVFNSGSRIGTVEKHSILFPVRKENP